MWTILTVPSRNNLTSLLTYFVAGLTVPNSCDGVYQHCLGCYGDLEICGMPRKWMQVYCWWSLCGLFAAKTASDLVKEMEEKKMVLNRKVCLQHWPSTVSMTAAESDGAFITAQSTCYCHLSYNRRISALIYCLWTGWYSLATGQYCLRWKFPGWCQCERFCRDRSLVWNFHISWAATDVSDCLLHLVLAPVLYKHHSRRSIIHQLLSAYYK